MNWLIENWQTTAALTIVALTAGIFLRRMLHRDKTSCGGGCECPTKTKAGKSVSQRKGSM